MQYRKQLNEHMTDNNFGWIPARFRYVILCRRMLPGLQMFIVFLLCWAWRFGGKRRECSLLRCPLQLVCCRWLGFARGESGMTRCGSGDNKFGSFFSSRNLLLSQHANGDCGSSVAFGGVVLNIVHLQLR